MSIHATGELDTGEEIVDLITHHKRPYVTWDPFMTEFHMLLCERLVAKLEPLI